MISDKDDARGAPALRSQIVISKKGRGGRRYRPYAFTEQGVAMLSSVLRSARAVEVNIAIMRTFLQLRRLMDTNRDLARKIGSARKEIRRAIQRAGTPLDGLHWSTGEATERLGRARVNSQWSSKRSSNSSLRPSRPGAESVFTSPRSQRPQLTDN